MTQLVLEAWGEARPHRRQESSALHSAVTGALGALAPTSARRSRAQGRGRSSLRLRLRPLPRPRDHVYFHHQLGLVSRRHCDHFQLLTLRKKNPKNSLKKRMWTGVSHAGHCLSPALLADHSAIRPLIPLPSLTAQEQEGAEAEDGKGALFEVSLPVPLAIEVVLEEER